MEISHCRGGREKSVVDVRLTSAFFLACSDWCRRDWILLFLTKVFMIDSSFICCEKHRLSYRFDLQIRKLSSLSHKFRPWFLEKLNCLKFSGRREMISQYLMRLRQNSNSNCKWRGLNSICDSIIEFKLPIIKSLKFLSRAYAVFVFFSLRISKYFADTVRPGSLLCKLLAL